MEEALVNFLHDDTSSDGMLELEPMSSYNRLLIHRLAEIFGFSHYSVGEGDERHLVLERCAETSVPAVLVSDLLWQFDELEGPRMSNILSRKRESSSGLNAELSSFNLSLEEREAAYLTARERIFSVDDGGNRGMVKQRPQKDPVVARRMIVHALGKKTKPSYESASQPSNVNIQGKNQLITRNIGVTSKVDMKNGSDSSQIKSMSGKSEDDKVVPSVAKRSENNMEKDFLRKEHMGAAKRMFVSALGFNPRGDGSTSKSNGLKPTRLSSE
ncbi:hypothetical protein Leryth_008825 [Lithospermum erythrorhizon]|nr:hypothetical protein Leryth_008825 [Lithospermum erythrorhizon]KAG9160431.1 hypothetical protein Leryth_008825 [Lithospermum erythrorhizon]